MNALESPLIARDHADETRELRSFGINFGQLESYECGAILLSLLAYPEPQTSEETLGDLTRTLCHLYLRGSTEEDAEWARTPQYFKPLYAFASPAEIERPLRTFKRRLRDRMVAAKMAMAYLHDGAKGTPPALPPTMPRLSLNELSKWVLGDLGSEEEGNVETRVWRPSLPVIHLATATATLIDRIEKEHPEVGPISFAHLLIHPELVRYLIELAAQHAQWLYQSKQLNLAPNTLIQVSATG